LEIGLRPRHLDQEDTVGRTHLLSGCAEHTTQPLLGVRGKSHSDEITYVKVEDFLLTGIPDDSVDLVFSFDCFCHISYTGLEKYLRNLHRKLRDGTKGLIMVGDYDTYIGSGEAPSVTPIYRSITEEIHDFGGPPYPGRWYWYGLDRFCGALEEFGYRVIERDIGIDERDPICLFSK
jgi:hypothetical protein